MNLRNIHETDAEAYIRLLEQIETESLFALLEARERKTTIQAQREEIREILASENQMIFVVEDRDQLVGWLGAFGGAYNRTRHAALIGIGIREAYHRQGIGTWLFQELEKYF